MVVGVNEMSPLTTPGRFNGALAKGALTTALLMNLGAGHISDDLGLTRR